MSHELDIRNGKTNFAYNLEEGLPWHGLGEGVQGVMTASDAIDRAGLGYEVIKEQAIRNGKPVDGRFWTVRADVDEVLGGVGKDYKIIQNREAFDFFDTLVDDGEAKYQTAGALAGGKRIFLTAHVGDDIQIAGQDSHRLYLCLLNSHDGSKSLTAITTMVRIVCANTETMALGSAKTSWTMTHRQSLAGKVSEARDALKLSFKYRDAFDEEVQRMLDIELTVDKFRKTMEDVLPKQKRQLEKNLDTLTVIFEESPTINDAGAGGTAWGGYNAVTEWLTHHKESRSEEARMTNSMWGFGAQVRSKTHKALVALAD